MYVPNSHGDNTVSVINGATCDAINTWGCGHTPPTIADPGNPTEAVVDQTTDTVYVGNGDGTVSVIDGGTCNGTVTAGCGQHPATVSTGASFIGDLTVNPVTRTVYTANFREGTVSVIDARTCNAAVSTGCGQTPAQVTLSRTPQAAGPSGIDVDLRTDTVYVTDCGHDPANGNCLGTEVSVIDGARCNSLATSGCALVPPAVTAGLGPYDVAIDQRTDTVFVDNISDYSVTVINGSSCNARVTWGCRRPFPTVQVGGAPDGVDVNPATHTAYVANYFDNDVSVLGPSHDGH